MPELDGFGLLQLLRQNPRTADLPVIVCTSHNDAEAIERAYRLGASSFVSKPINWPQFLHHAQFVMRNGETERALRAAKIEAQSASRTKSAMFQVLTHELKTPLTALIGLTSLIDRQLRGQCDPQVTQQMEHVVDASQRLNGIVSDIMLLAKAVAGEALGGAEGEMNSFLARRYAVPVAVAARHHKVPIVTYLPDVEPGSSIRFVVPMARRIACTTDGSRAYVPAANVVVTGYPVRPDIRAARQLTKEQALAHFDLAPGRPTLFVFGGSRGARNINRALMAALPQLLAEAQVIHISGTLTWPEVEANAATLPADLTVTVGFPKHGHFLGRGPAVTGALLVADIGIPGDLAQAISLEMATPRAVAELLPARPITAHKGAFGKALIVAGSVYFTGAAGLAAQGATRAGAGLVTLGVARPLHAILAPVLLEVTWLPLAHDMGVLASDAARMLNEKLAGYTALLIGPGLSTEKETGAFLKAFFQTEEPKAQQRSAIGFAASAPERSASKENERPAGPRTDLPPLVVDADALNWLAQQENLIAIRPREPEDRRLTLTADQQNLIFLLSVFVLPVLVFAAGVYSWYGRR